MKTSKIRMVQVTDKKTILTWVRKFAKEYLGHDEMTYDKEQISVLLDPKICKYLFAFRGQIPLGFVRITSLSELGTFPMWSIQDAFVRKGSRSKGILKMLLEKCISDFDCGYILLSYDRVIKYQFYYASLGLVHQIKHPYDASLRYLATQKFMDVFDSHLPAAA